MADMDKYSEETRDMFEDGMVGGSLAGPIDFPVSLVPFDIPTSVRMKMPPKPRQSGWQARPSIPLKDLDKRTLSDLCDRFRAEVFAKAGFDDPREET